MKKYLLGMVFLGMLIGGCEAEPEDDAPVTSQQALTQTFATGSYVIPMDTTHQNLGTLKAFGLVYRLLTNGVPVHWVIDEAKAQNGVDFTATTINIQTFATQTHGYRGGPFVIDSANAAAALPIIQSWHTNGHITTVHESTAEFTANVSRTLRSAPTIGIFQDDNEVIAFRYLNAAGIPDSLGQTWPNAAAASYPAFPDVLTAAELAGVSGVNDGILLDSNGAPTYCQLTSMHYDTNAVNSEVVREVRRWLEATPSTHAFMECDAIDSFENNVNGRFLSTQGLSGVGGNPNPVISQDPGNPFVQFDGSFTAAGGSIRAFALSTGSSLYGTGQTLIVRQAAPSTMVYLSGTVDGDPTKGKVTYLGGHEYSTTLPISTNASTNGVRLFLNSLFESPCAQADAQPTVTITISGPAQTTDTEVTYSITVNNAGPGFARDVRVVAPIPVGATFVGASLGGVLNAGEVSWELGSLLAGDGATLTLTVALGLPGIYTQETTVGWKVGLTAFSASATQNTELLVPGVPVSITSPTQDQSINDPTPEITGSVEAGATVVVEVRDSTNTVVFTGDAVVTGTSWTITSTALIDGDYTVTATATDATNQTGIATTSFNVDTEAPAIAITSPVDGTTTSSTTIAISGTAEAGSEVAVEIRDSQGNVVFAGDAILTGTDWTIDTNALAEGDYTVTATATDQAGNTASDGPVSFGVDTTPPTIALLTPADGSTVGPTPVVSGSVEAGALVEVEIRDSTNTVVFAGNATVTGTSFSLQSTALPDGVYTVTASATDAAGNSAQSGTHTFNVDATFVSISITSPADGAAVNDGIIELNGTTTGDTVSVEVQDDQGTVVFSGNATIDGSGNWTITTTNLPDGDYTISATATDGGTTATSSIDLSVDTVAPAIAITTPTQGSVHPNPEVLVSGTAEVGAVVTVQVLDSQNQEVFAGTANRSGGDWSLTTDALPDGIYTVTATATDAAGNNTTTPSRTFAVSRPGPTLMIRSPLDGTAYPVDTLEVSGFTTADEVDVVVRDEDGEIVAEFTLIRNNDGDFLGEVADLEDGVYTFEFTATDGIGTSSVTHTVTIDTIAPVTTITSPNEGAVTNDNTPTITGTGEPGSTVEVSINGEFIGQAVVRADGTWTVPVTQPLDDGEYTITVESSDNAGNQGEPVSRSFVVNTQVPNVTITTPAPDQRFFTGDITVVGTADPGQEVDVFLDGVLIGTVTADANGDWSLEISVGEGLHVIEAVATDEAGNTGSSGTITFRFRLPADLVVTSPSNGATVEGPMVTVTGTAEPGSQVTIEVNGETVVVVADSNGNWSATLTVPPGETQITVTDEFGQSTQITVTVEEGTDPDPDPDPSDPNATYLAGGGCSQAPGDRAPLELLLIALGFVGLRLRNRV